MCCSTAPWRRAARVAAFAGARRIWDGDIVSGRARFVTAIGAGTTYPDYKPAPFIVSVEVDGVDMVTVVTEGIFSYCGVKVKIDTDRHLGPECAVVRAEGEPVGHVTTGEYGSQMLSLGGVNHLTARRQEGGPRHLRDAARPLQRQGGRTDRRRRRDGDRRRPASRRSSTASSKSACASAAARRRSACSPSNGTARSTRSWWSTTTSPACCREHQAGKLLGARDTGIHMKGRRSTPGRYFQVAEPGTGWGGTDDRRSAATSSPASIPKVAWPGLTHADGLDDRRAARLLSSSTRSCGRSQADLPADSARVGRAHQRELRAGALHRAVHGRRRRLAARRRHGKPGAADALGAGRADHGDCGRRAGLCLARRRHHLHGRRDAAAATTPSATCRRRRSSRRSSSPCGSTITRRSAATWTRCGRSAEVLARHGERATNVFVDGVADALVQAAHRVSARAQIATSARRAPCISTTGRST